jgi:predicted O-linked N-acetylglucosamine transferase (SPINDLY family)
MTVDQLFQLAVQHHQSGRLAEAERTYRQILLGNPKHADALHMLGVLAHQAGQNATAVESIRQAAAIRPDVAHYQSNLGLVLNAAGRFSEALPALESAVRINPGLAEAHNNLAIALWQTGQKDRAIAAWKDAIRLRPQMAEAHNSLGIALKQLGRLSEAASGLRTAVGLMPQRADFHDNLGTLLWSLGRVGEAADEYRAAIRLQPSAAEFHNHLGSALWASGRLDDAVSEIQIALQLNPQSAAAHANLGNVLKDQGKLEGAIASFRTAVALDPTDAATHSSLIYLLYFQPKYDQELLGQELAHWNAHHAQPLASQIRPHTNDCTPNRRLRIGYVSPDLREHAVGRFMLPLLRNHDHEQFEIACYSDVAAEDSLTAQLKPLADRWVRIVGMSNEEVAELIRRDQIDILIDLAAHTPGNRLLVFARQPAPVQATYLSYPSTTGLKTIQYRITDPYLDPPDDANPVYSEQSLRLPDTYWCYEPGIPAPDVGPLPALSNAHITFGCLNTFRKVNTDSMLAWARILRDVPQSRLILHVIEGSQRQQVLELFHGADINADRIDFVGHVPLAAYMQTYQRIDIGLDPFPYTGGTTTCDALWMGVPVVTLAGRTAVHRGGVSILSNLGMPQLIAQSIDQYVQIATPLAGDVGKLTEMRKAMREKMLHSPLMDAPGFARGLETLYRSVWQKWCSDRP